MRLELQNKAVKVVRAVEAVKAVELGWERSKFEAGEAVKAVKAVELGRKVKINPTGQKKNLQISIYES